MTERPILFSAPMIRAILAGTKSQTRRAVKWPRAAYLFGRQPWPEHAGTFADGRPENQYIHCMMGGGDYGAEGCAARVSCPYGEPGDRLYVRETHYRFGRWVRNGKTAAGRQKWTFRAADFRAVLYTNDPPASVGIRRGMNRDEWWKRPAIFMPRWASRLTPELTAVRVQRVQEISEEDAQAEGADGCHGVFHRTIQSAIDNVYRRNFAVLWDSINGKRPGCAWADSPWVWALSFRRVERGGGN